jgi:hypothetical protein
MQKPIVPAELYRAVRNSQLIGVSGYSREVLILNKNLSCLQILQFFIFYFYLLFPLARVVFTYSILQYIASCGAPYSNLTLLIALLSVLLTYSSFHLLQGLPVFAMGVGLSTFDKASVSIMITFLIECSLIQSLIWNKNFYHLISIKDFYLYIFSFCRSTTMCSHIFK